jgi:nucleotide-binding universal stress UspA family protein
MTYGTVLLHLDDDPLLERRTEAAIHLASRFESHLTGLAATGNIPFGESAGAGHLSPRSLEEALRASRKRAQERASQFTARANASRIRSSEAIVDDDDDASAVLRAALCSDLLIIGQPDPSADGSARRRRQHEEVILKAAPPRLVLPCTSFPVEFGSRVLVGWNATPECARAVTAALPFLLRALSVHVVQFESPLSDMDARPGPSIDAVRQWFCRNAVSCDVSLRPDAWGIGEHLMSLAVQSGADLLVVGAWSRPRWSEQLFGGATRTILDHPGVPILTAR